MGKQLKTFFTAYLVFMVVKLCLREGPHSQINFQWLTHLLKKGAKDEFAFYVRTQSIALTVLPSLFKTSVYLIFGASLL